MLGQCFAPVLNILPGFRDMAEGGLFLFIFVYGGSYIGIKLFWKTCFWASMKSGRDVWGGEDEHRKLIPKCSPRIGFAHPEVSSATFEMDTLLSCRLTSAACFWCYVNFCSENVLSVCTPPLHISIKSQSVSSSLVKLSQLEPTGPSRHLCR